MPQHRNIPLGVSRELDRQESAEALLVFLTIRSTVLSEPIRVVSDPENFILDGFEYQGFFFDITLLDDTDKMPQAQLTVQNIDTKMSTGILNCTEPVRLDIEVVALSEFDMTQFPRTEIDTPSPRVYAAKHLWLTDVEGTVMQLTGTIRSWDYVQETWPAVRATQTRFPGLYWS